MSIGHYEIYLITDRGDRLAFISGWTGLDYTKVMQGVGGITLTVPKNFDARMLRDDYKLEVWRSYPTSDGTRAPLRLEIMGFVRGWQRKVDQNGIKRIQIIAVDANDLVSRRIIAYPSDSIYGLKTNVAADDFMKAMVRENLGALTTDAARKIDSQYLSVEADKGIGCAVTRNVAYMYLGDALNAVSDASWVYGNPTFWQVEALDSKQFQFKTYSRQIGTDRTGGAGFLKISENRSNARNFTTEWDAALEQNFIYAAGQGEGSARVVQTASNPARIGVSVFGRREGFRDAREVDTTAGVQGKAYEALQANRARLSYVTELVENEGQRYGRDWNFGDRIAVGVEEMQCNSTALIKAVRVEITGTEKITPTLETIA